MTPACDRTLLLQAEFDGELDAGASAALAAHRADCADCAENWRLLAAAREAMVGATRHAAPPALRAALAHKLIAPARKRWVREGLSFVAGAALAAGIGFALLPSGGGESSLVAAVVDDHVRSLEPGHLADVVSTDRHTVKPWFDGRLDFAPPVKDLAGQGFPLLGGRLDYLAGHPAAALVYGHDKHRINLLVWPEKGVEAPASLQREGYNLVHWRGGGMEFWAVSDLEA
ncbi:MAG: anti-sigma factor family protein, partial [Stellaceae bacterium]